MIFHPVPGVTPKRLFGEDVFIKRIVALEGDTLEVIRSLSFNLIDLL